MTENTAIEETPKTDEQATPVESPADVETLEEVPEDDTAQRTNREAAKFRKRLRETELERDQISERLATANTALLDRLLTDYTDLTKPVNPDSKYGGQDETANVRLRHATDLKLFTNKTATDFLDDDGNLDATKIGEALQGLYTERPEIFETGHTQTRVPNTWGRPESRQPANRFQDAFAPER